MDRSRIAIVIPALNESATIAQVVARVGRYGTAVVVDDGSSDDTGALAQRAGAKVVRHDRNRGYDAALESGFSCAATLGCDYVITIDADGQHNPAQLAQVIAHLDAGCDLVLGVRDRQQRLAEHVFAWVAQSVWKVADPLCGMKGYRMALYQRCGHFDSFRSIGTELALRSLARGARVAQMPVLTRERRDAPRFASRFRANGKILRALLILLWLQLSGRLAGAADV
jgi:glycosyltransferase involved in cell wall biosynthesis